MTKKILAADIGGTNSRFGAFEINGENTLDLLETCWLDTLAFATFSDLLYELENRKFTVTASSADAAVFAIAGPVENDVFSSPPNIKWDIDITDASDEFGMKTCLLINDFIAQAYACRTPIMEDARLILSGNPDHSAPLTVIGAGTGLGQATLIPLEKGGYTALASEGAHAGFGFESDSEFPYMQFLRQITGEPYVRAETVVSGAGLSHLHRFLTGERLAPAEVAAALDAESKTLRWMARFFGRLSRNLALQVVALGGVYISGGVAAKVPELVTHSEFARSFRQSTKMHRILKRIPVYLNSNEESGLWGAAFKALQIIS
jgi:glucokinase